MLRSMTFDARDAADGTSAMASVRDALKADQPFDIVFVDWRMPGMDGLETIEAIRDLCAGGRMPAFVLVTAYGGEEIIHRASRAGIEEILVKPVNPSNLLDAAARALNILEAEPAMVPPPVSGDHPVRLDGLRILVAEDNGLNQDVVRELLGSAGAETDIVDDGAEALERLARHRYDLVLMDMQMPVMDGLTACRQLRQNRHTRRFRSLQ